MVYRIYVEKKQGLTAEADALRNDIVNLLGIKGLTGLRLLNRYDAEQLDKDLFNTILNDIQPVTKSVKIIVPVPDIPKADISDYFQAGKTFD